MKKIDRERLRRIPFDALKDEATEKALLDKIDELVNKINRLENMIRALQQVGPRQE